MSATKEAVGRITGEEMMNGVHGTRWLAKMVIREKVALDFVAKLWRPCSVWWGLDGIEGDFILYKSKSLSPPFDPLQSAGIAD